MSKRQVCRGWIIRWPLRLLHHRTAQVLHADPRAFYARQKFQRSQDQRHRNPPQRRQGPNFQIFLERISRIVSYRILFLKNSNNFIEFRAFRAFFFCFLADFSHIQRQSHPPLRPSGPEFVVQVQRLRQQQQSDPCIVQVSLLNIFLLKTLLYSTKKKSQ